MSYKINVVLISLFILVGFGALFVAPSFTYAEKLDPRKDFAESLQQGGVIGADKKIPEIKTKQTTNPSGFLLYVL